VKRKEENIGFPNWLMTILSFTGGFILIVVKLVGSNWHWDSTIIQMSLIVASLAIFISLLESKLNFNRNKHDKDINEVKNLIKEVKSECRDDIYSKIENIKHEYLSNLARVITHNNRESLYRILGKLTSAIEMEMDERTYLIRMRERVDKLNNGFIYAACGQKTWSLPEIQAYWHANKIACTERKVKIIRIFIDVEMDDEAKKSAYEQIDSGIEVRNLSEESKNKLVGLDDLQPDLGFVVIGDERTEEVIIHWQKKDGKRVGIHISQFSNELGIADALKKIFWIIYYESTLIEPQKKG